MSADQIFVDVRDLPAGIATHFVRHRGVLAVLVDIWADRYDLLRSLVAELDEYEQDCIFEAYGWDDAKVPLEWLAEAGPIPGPGVAVVPRGGRRRLTPNATAPPATEVGGAVGFYCGASPCRALVRRPCPCNHDRVPDPSIVLTQNTDGTFDLVCRECGGASRVHPDEPVIDQVRLFLKDHRHNQRARNPN